MWPSGERYEGDWEDGKEHGAGTAVSADGSSFFGTWVHGKRHGEGVGPVSACLPSPISPLNKWTASGERMGGHNLKENAAEFCQKLQGQYTGQLFTHVASLCYAR